MASSALLILLAVAAAYGSTRHVQLFQPPGKAVLRAASLVLFAGGLARAIAVVGGAVGGTMVALVAMSAASTLALAAPLRARPTAAALGATCLALAAAALGVW